MAAQIVKQRYSVVYWFTELPVFGQKTLVAIWKQIEVAKFVKTDEWDSEGA